MVKFPIYAFYISIQYGGKVPRTIGYNSRTFQTRHNKNILFRSAGVNQEPRNLQFVIKAPNDYNLGRVHDESGTALVPFQNSGSGFEPPFSFTWAWLRSSACTLWSSSPWRAWAPSPAGACPGLRSGRGGDPGPDHACRTLGGSGRRRRPGGSRTERDESWRLKSLISSLITQDWIYMTWFD